MASLSHFTWPRVYWHFQCKNIYQTYWTSIWIDNKFSPFAKIVFFISWGCMELHSKVTSHKSIPQFSLDMYWNEFWCSRTSVQWVPSVSFRLVERWPWENEFLCSDSVFSIHHAYLWILVTAKRNLNCLVPQNLTVHESSPMTEDSDGQEGHDHSWQFCLVDS